MVFKLLVLLIGLCSAANRPACTEAGGMCHPSGTDCEGEVLKGKKYCTTKKEICCVPLPPNDDCPESEGFFKMSSPSNKCYKYFNQVRLNFTDAQTFCLNQPQGLRLAEVDNAIELRSYLFQRYGGIWTSTVSMSPVPLVNARGNVDGTMFQWQTSGVLIPHNSLFWGYPGIGFPKPTNDWCLNLLTTYFDFTDEPDSPYYRRECSASYFILCEKA